MKGNCLRGKQQTIPGEVGRLVNQDALESPSCTKRTSKMQLLHGYSLLVRRIGNGKKEGLKHAWRFNDFKAWSCPSGQAKTIKNLCSSVLSQASYSNDCAKNA